LRVTLHQAQAVAIDGKYYEQRVSKQACDMQNESLLRFKVAQHYTVVDAGQVQVADFTVTTALCEELAAKAKEAPVMTLVPIEIPQQPSPKADTKPAPKTRAEIDLERQAQEFMRGVKPMPGTR
jgi:hypothetical protein